MLVGLTRNLGLIHAETVFSRRSQPRSDNARVRRMIQNLLRDHVEIDSDSSSDDDDESVLMRMLRQVVDDEDAPRDPADTLPEADNVEVDDDDDDLDPSRAGQQEVNDQQEYRENDAEEAWKVITAEQSMKISRWPQFGTSKSIGAVHSGKIVLFTVENDDGERVLVDGNIKKGYAGGQIYMPMSKKIMHDQDFLSNKDILTLPANLMNLFVNGPALGSTAVDSMIKKAKYAAKKLEDLHRHGDLEIQTKHRNNCVRYEMFVPVDPLDTTLFQESDRDYLGGLLVSKPHHLAKQYAKLTKEVSAPLYVTMVENNLGDALWKLSVPTKAMLLLCAEMAVKLAGFHPFEGRLMKQLLPTAAYDGQVHRWKLPQAYLVGISKNEHEKTGLLCGLHQDLVEVTLDTTTTRPSENNSRQDYMKLPLYIQMYQQLVNTGVNHTPYFLRLQMKLFSLTWDVLDRRDRSLAYIEEHWRRREAIDIGVDPAANSLSQYCPPKRSIFHRPDLTELASCTPRQLTMLMEKMAQVITHAYDYEWCAIYKSAIYKHHKKHKRGPMPRFKLTDFPTTEEEVKTFLRDRMNSQRGGQNRVQYFTRQSACPNKNIGNVIRTDEDFMGYICYRMDLGPDLKTWKRSLTWNLLHIVQDMRYAAAAALSPSDTETMDLAAATLEGAINQPQTKADILSDENFSRVLRQVFQSSYRRKYPLTDKSRAIVWHSNNRQYQKAEEANAGRFVFQPMILDIKEGLPPNSNHPNTQALQQQYLPKRREMPANHGETYNANRRLQQSPSRRAQARQPQDLPPPQQLYPYENRVLDKKKRNAFFCRGKVDVTAIIRIRMLLYRAFVVGEFTSCPNGNEIHDLIHSKLTATTELADFFQDGNRLRKAFQREFRDRGMPQQGRWLDWRITFFREKDLPLQKCKSSDWKAWWSRNDKAKAATGKIYAAAIRNSEGWSKTNPKSIWRYEKEMEANREVNRENRAEMEEENIEKKADDCLRKYGLLTTMASHCMEGIITPRFLDSLREEWHQLLEKCPLAEAGSTQAAGKRKREEWQTGPHAATCR